MWILSEEYNWSLQVKAEEIQDKQASMLTDRQIEVRLIQLTLAILQEKAISEWWYCYRE